MRRNTISDLIYEYRAAPKRYKLPVMILSLLTLVSVSAMVMSVNYVMSESIVYVFSILMFGMYAYSFILGAMGILGHSVVDEYHAKKRERHHKNSHY